MLRKKEGFKQLAQHLINNACNYKSVVSNSTSPKATMENENHNKQKSPKKSSVAIIEFSKSSKTKMTLLKADSQQPVSQPEYENSLLLWEFLSLKVGKPAKFCLECSVIAV